MRKIILIIATLIYATIASGQYLELDPNVEFKEVYARLGIDIPDAATRHPSVWLRLEELKREPCDQKSIQSLADQLEKNGHRRIAAIILFKFVKSCGAPTIALHKSIDILLKLSAYEIAVEVADYFVAIAPNDSNARYLRGLAMVGLGVNAYAVTDFANAIELYELDRKSIASKVFFKMAEAYAADKRYCEAITPIETWIRIDPTSRDNSRARKIINEYDMKGQCRTSDKFVSERFPRRGNSQTILVSVEINGVKGRFILDTGASYVVLSSGFSKRSNVKMADRSEIRLQTANGEVVGNLTKVDQVKLGKIESKMVPTVILMREDALGSNIDGLLGMSFLSKFDMKFDNSSVLIETRK